MAAKKNAPKPPTDTSDDAEPGEAPRNLTRESIEQFLTSRLQEAKPLGEGLSPEDAEAKAKKRALEMCPD
jgi:hypothetical protein